MKGLFLAAISTPKGDAECVTLPKLLERIRTDYPRVQFVESNQFSWHAGAKHISYLATAADDPRGTWALLHELGHALLNHTDYESDAELLGMEVAAWEKAEELASAYGIQIADDYTQHCLDSYRDWLHVRATCPSCYVRSLQTSPRSYTCHSCGTTWNVSRSRHCRPYRKKRVAANR